MDGERDELPISISQLAELIGVDPLRLLGIERRSSTEFVIVLGEEPLCPIHGVPYSDCDLMHAA